MNRRKKRREGISVKAKPWSPNNNRIGIKSRPLNLGKPTKLFDEKRKPSWFNDKVWGTEKGPRVVTKDRQRSGPPTIGRTMDISKKVDLFGGRGRKPSWFNDSVWSPRGRDRDFDGVPDRKDCNPRNPWLTDDDKGRVFVDAYKTPTGDNFEEPTDENKPYEGTQAVTVYEPRNMEKLQPESSELQPSGEISDDNINDEFTFTQAVGEEPRNIKQVNEIPEESNDVMNAELLDDDDEYQDEEYWYLYYRLEDGKWYLDNAYTEEELQEASNRIKNYPGVVEVRVSKEDILNKLNRSLGLKNVGDTLSKAASKVGDYTERQQFRSNFQQQLQGARRNYQTQQQRPTQRPTPNRPQPQSRMQQPTQPNINIFQDRRLPPNGNGVGRVQPYSPVTAQQSTVPRITRQQQPYGSNRTFQNPNYDMGVQRKVRNPGLHTPNPMSVNLSSGNSGTGLGRRTGGNVTRPKFMIPMGDIKFLRFGRRLE